MVIGRAARAAGRSYGEVALAPVVPSDAPAAAAWPWLKLEVDAERLAGRWMRLRYRSGLLDPLVRPMLRCIGTQPTPDRMLPGAMFGRGVWLGRIPRGTREVWISPAAAAGRFAFAIDGIDLPSHFELGKGLLRQAPRRFLIWVFAPMIGLQRASDVQIRRQLSPTPLSAYDAWRRSRSRPYEPFGFDARPLAGPTPHIRLVMAAVPGGAERFAHLLVFLAGQPHDRWSVALVGEGDAAAAMALGSPAGRVIVVDADASLRACAHGLDASDLLAPFALGDAMPDYALSALAQAGAEVSDAAGFYADADAMDEHGRFCQPMWRTDWPALAGLVAFDPGCATAFRAALFTDLLPDHPAADLLASSITIAARIAAAGRFMHHIRRVLRTRSLDRRHPRSGIAPPPAALAAMAPGPPQATIIIPTRDRLALLTRCIDSIRPCVARGAEVVVVDNGSVEPRTKAFLAALPSEAGFEVLVDEGAFNFSRLCNAGAARARMPVLVFLNNDTEALDADWLGALTRWVHHAAVGAVGAKLLFPDGSVQHAGVVLGIDDLAGHFERGCGRDAAGFFNRLGTPHRVSAVTAACLAVEKRKFDAVGGFDEARLPVDLNDIDLCLRLAARGWACLFEPGAVLIHHESASRGIPHRPDLRYRAELAYFRANWADLIRDDPHGHPGLSADSLPAQLG